MNIQPTNNIKADYKVKQKAKTSKQEADTQMKKDGNKKIALAASALAAASVAGIAIAVKKTNIIGIKKTASMIAKKAASLTDDTQRTISNNREAILKKMESRGAELTKLKDGTQAYVTPRGRILAQKVVHKNGAQEFKVFNPFGEHIKSHVAAPDGKFFSLSSELENIKDFIAQGKDISTLGNQLDPIEFFKESYYSIFK